MAVKYRTDHQLKMKLSVACSTRYKGFFRICRCPVQIVTGVMISTGIRQIQIEKELHETQAL